MKDLTVSQGAESAADKADLRELAEVKQQSDRTQKRAALKKDLREKMQTQTRTELLLQLIPKVLTKQERQRQAALKRKEQQKNKPSVAKHQAKHKGGKFRQSKKLKPSAFQKASLKSKPSRVEHRRQSGDLQNAIDSLKRATSKLFEKSNNLGYKRRGAQPSSTDSLQSPAKIGSRESLPSPAKTDTAVVAVEKTRKEEDSLLKTEAQTKAVLEEAQVQLLKLTALNLQLEKDTERTEKREVAFIEAQLVAEATKVKNTAEGIHRGIFAYFIHSF